MLDHVVIEPMTEAFILWRCLHGGPLSQDTLTQTPTNNAVQWATRRAINLPLLTKLITTYGTCAMLARDGDHIVGFLRFYPKPLVAMEEAGGFCLQQAFPHGPSEHFVNHVFPPLDEFTEKTLTVHCLMTGSPFQEANPYQRKGLGTRLARALMRWAHEAGWERIEATAYEDLDILYANTGQAGRRFWEKLGFRVVKTEIERGFHGAFLKTAQEQAVAQGLPPEKASNKYTMRIDLSEPNPRLRAPAATDHPTLHRPDDRTEA